MAPPARGGGAARFSSSFKRSSSDSLCYCKISQVRRDQRWMEEAHRLVWRVLRNWAEIAHLAGAFHAAAKQSHLDARRGWGELRADRGGMVDRAFAFRRGRSEFGGRSLLHRHTRRYAPLDCAASGLIAPRTDDRRYGDASGRRHPLPRCAAPLSENGATIDHVLGAMNYRLLRMYEARSTQVKFRRLPVPRNAAPGSCQRGRVYPLVRFRLAERYEVPVMHHAVFACDG